MIMTKFRPQLSVEYVPTLHIQVQKGNKVLLAQKLKIPNELHIIIYFNTPHNYTLLTHYCCFSVSL